MKLSKKIQRMLGVFVIVGGLLAGCANTQSTTEEKTTVNVVALKGPTAMGLVSFMDEVDQGKVEDADYKFQIASAPDEVPSLVAKGEVDIALIPANLSSVFYNNTDHNVQVLGINTLGVLNIVGTDQSVTSVADLRGKTIYASGKGSTPEYALNWILHENGIDPNTDVTIEWKSEHTECLAAVLQNDQAVALLPQPFVTTAQMNNENVQVLIDLTKEWDALDNESSLLTGVVIARKDFIEEHPEVVEAFMQHYEDSVKFVNENIDDAAVLVDKYDIVPKKVAQKAIPNCNITLITGDEMKTKLSGYLTVLFEQNPKSVGGQLPEDDFYYGTK